MIWVSEAFLWMCSLSVLHPTVLVQDGVCVAVCDSEHMPHACYDANGAPLQDCFDGYGHEMLCDADIVEVTDGDWELMP